MAAAAPTDEELMRAHAAGDARAFEALYQRYERKLFGFFVRAIGDRVRAEDLLQQTFLNVHRARQRYRGGGFAAWIRAIAFNVYREELRRRARRPEAALVDEPADAAPNPAARADATSQWGRVRAALDSLSPANREAVVLCRLLELDYAEAATLAGCSPDAMKLRAFRGLRALRAAVGGATDEAATSENSGASSKRQSSA